jgi:hypothetical protein
MGSYQSISAFKIDTETSVNVVPDDTIKKHNTYIGQIVTNKGNVPLKARESKRKQEKAIQIVPIEDIQNTQTKNSFKRSKQQKC